MKIKSNENKEKVYLSESEENEDSEENEISESQNENGRIIVYVRIRPFNISEIQIDKTSPIKSIDTKNNTLTCKIILI